MKPEKLQFFKNFVLDDSFNLSFIKPVVWAGSWLFGVHQTFGSVINLALTNDSNKLLNMWGGACLIFAISLIIETLPIAQKATTKWRRFYYLIWSTILMGTIFLTIKLMNDGASDEWLLNLIYGSTVISLIMLAICFVAAVLVAGLSEESKNESDLKSDKEQNSVKSVFEEKLEAGQLGDIEKEDNNNG